MASLVERMRLARDPRAARIQFLTRKAVSEHQGGGDPRGELWRGNSNGGAAGGGGAFNPPGGGGEQN